MIEFKDNDVERELALDQARIDEMLGDTDIGYIKECIGNQIENIFDTNEKNNFIKYLEKQLEKSENIDPYYARSIMEDFYKDVITKISDKLNFTIDDTEIDRKIMAKNLYKFFVLQYPFNLILFLEMVIIEEKKSISKELEGMQGINSKRIPGINSELAIILHNMAAAINVISGMGYDFDDYLDFISKHEDSKSTVEDIKNYSNNYMDETDDILKMAMDNLINENEGFGDIYCQLQSRLYNRFVKI